jgi:translocation and assembly module TamB
MRKLLHTSWILLVLALVLPLGALYYLTHTEAGLRVLASTLSRQLGPVTLEISGVSGTLAQGAHFERVVVEHRRVRVEADDADLRLAVLPLAWQMIDVRTARFGTVRIDVHPRPHGPHTWKPHFLPALMRLRADSLHTDRLVITAPSSHSVEFNDIDAQVTMYSKSIRAYSGSARLEGMRLVAQGEVLAADPIGLRGSVRWQFAPEGQPAWVANGTFSGDLDRLAIDGHLLEPFRASARGAMLDLAQHWQFEGKSHIEHLDLAAWGGGTALGIITGELDLRGDHRGYGATGQLVAPGLHAGPQNVDFFGQYAAHVLHVERLRVNHADSGSALQLRGEVGIVEHGPRLALDGEWSALRWPLAATDAPLHDSAGSFRLQGVRPYAIDAQGGFAAARWPAATFIAHGRLDHDRLEIDEGSVALFGGEAQLSADIRWSPRQRWSLRGRAQGIDAANLRQGLQGSLGFRLRLDGEGFDGKLLHARFDDLGGRLRGQPLGGHAWFSSLADGWRFEDVRVQLGQTRVELSGRTGAQIDLKFAVDADDLALLVPEATGHLAASGHIGGTAHDPVVALIARGADIAWGDLRLGSLRVNVDVDPAGSGRMDSLLRADTLHWRERAIDSITIETQGTSAAHSAGIHVRAPGLDADGRGTGSVRDGEWQLRLAALDITDHKDLTLKLEAPAELALSAIRWRIGQLCLRDENAHLCGHADSGPAGLSVNFNASGLPLDALTSGLVAGTSFEGTLKAEAALRMPAHGDWAGSVHSELAGASIRHRRSNERIESLDLGNGSVSVELLPARAELKLLLDAGTTGRLEGQLMAHQPASAASWRNWSIDGQLRIDSDAVGFVDSYLTQIDRVTGRLGAELRIGGSIAAPLLNGELKVANGTLDAYQVNLALREINFRAVLRDNTLAIEGSADAGVDGHGKLSGNLLWRDGEPYGDLHITGTDLRLVNIPEVRIQASPDVNLKLAGRRIDVTGTVTLPYARFEPAELTNAVLASSDEVLVNQPQVPPEERYHVFSRLTLKLGERVTIDTLGLSGRLGGSVTVTTNDTGINRGTGELSVEEGKYVALGRRLDVEHGRLLFSNGLLSDPGVDLRATKRFPDITAGVNVRGTLRNPRMTFFSEPAVSQSQIVSLLLAGGTLESVQNTADPTTRSDSARSELLLQGGAILAQQFGRKVGIDDVSVESDLSNTTSLVLGRYLSPRLYVSYGISLAEAINTVKMRYTIGDRWTIKTEVGKERSADLVYTIEK